jgi:hypothetical protein
MALRFVPRIEAPTAHRGARAPPAIVYAANPGRAGKQLYEFLRHASG